MIHKLHQDFEQALDTCPVPDTLTVRELFKAGYVEGCKSMLDVLLDTDLDGLTERALEAINEVRRLMNGAE